MNYRYYIQAGEQWDIQKYLSNSVEDINKYLRFNLNHMECGKYRCTILRMSPNRGGLLEEWKNLGFQNQLNHEDIDYLRKKCVPFMERKYIQVEEDKTLKLHIEIETQEIVCIKLRKCQ
jgi:beta-xylosidase